MCRECQFPKFWGNSQPDVKWEPTSWYRREWVGGTGCWLIQHWVLSLFYTANTSHGFEKTYLSLFGREGGREGSNPKYYSFVLVCWLVKGIINFMLRRVWQILKTSKGKKNFLAFILPVGILQSQSRQSKKIALHEGWPLKNCSIVLELWGREEWLSWGIIIGE